MIKTAMYFLVMAAAMLGISRLLPGFEISGWGAAILAAMNTIVKPILFVLTLPFTILTLGLFLFVLNAIVLWLTSLVVPGFKLHGFWTAVLASLLLAIVSMIWKSVTKPAPPQQQQV